MKNLNTRQRPSWREYQQQLQRPTKEKTILRRILFAILGTLSVFSIYIGFSSPGATNNGRQTAAADSEEPVNQLISKKEVQQLLNQVDLDTVLREQIDLPFKDRHVNVKTTLDLDLQNHLIEAMDRKNSRFIGIVVMEPDSGKVLSLAGFDKTNPKANPCLSSEFPAASLFKIVTAAAAVDQYNYTSTTLLRFNGYKHTLYKSQLKETNNHNTQTISFADSFAQSVNPVFGKIGTLQLGKQMLEKYGLGFGFNQPLDFELTVVPSRLTVGDTPYQWAEIASGFNKDTTLSPLHAAAMVSAVLNQGYMATPNLVERIIDSNGEVIYRCQPAWERRAMTSKASAVLADMMETTVKTGTAKRLFRSHDHDSILSQLRIGGKTGSIFNSDRDARIDWFAGFAEEKDGARRLVVAVLVAHEKYIGIRAGAYARMAISYYFNNHLAHQQASQPDKSNG